MDFKPIKTKKIYEEIIDQVKAMIGSGTLRPGDRLMSERELAEKLQVGRSAVREAFRVMEAMGILKIKPGEGTYINEQSVESLVNSFSPVLLADRENVREFMELRRILEVEAAGLAAQRRSPEQLEAIHQALQQLQQDVVQGNLGGEADLQFHFAVAEAAHNSFLLKLMNTVGDIMSRVLSAILHILYQNPDNPPRIIREHQAIYTAIQNGDPTGARRAMLEHLTNAEEYAFSNMEVNKF